MGIDKNESLSTAIAGLRRNAEEQLLTRPAHLSPPRIAEETQRLVHELEVHQIELEMQNEELRHSRDEMETVMDRYRDLYDFAPISYFTLDSDGTISAVNLTGASLFGIERARMLGRRFERFVAIDARSLFSEFLGKVFARQGKESCEMTLTNEVNHPLFVQIEALADTAGNECQIAVINITERRCAEDALAEKKRMLDEINISLETRIIQAVEELRQKDQLLIMQDRLAVMGEMINNIAHQWRQPLNTLGLIVQNVQICYGTDEFSGEFLKKNTNEVMELIKHMSRTVDDFRNFFKPDKKIVAFSINQVIAHAHSLIKKSFMDQKIRITLDPVGDPIANGHPNEYAQVLLNILMNARDALVEHNIGDALISIRSFTEAGKTVVTITDNAGGIPDEIKGRLFDPYFTTKGPDKGTGIGLFMSKSIIEKSMKGRLTVRNTGNGAEFRIEV